MVGLYPSIPHQAGLIALKKAFDKRLSKKIPTDDLINMAEFVLSKNLLNLIVTLSSKYQGLCLHPDIPAFTWIKLNRNF